MQAPIRFIPSREHFICFGIQTLKIRFHGRKRYSNAILKMESIISESVLVHEENRDM